MNFLGKVVIAAFMICSGLVAHAAKVVYITTHETATDGVRALNNGWGAIQAAFPAASDTVVDLRYGLAQDGSHPSVPSVSPADLADADIVVVVTIYGVMHADKLAMLEDLMLNDSSKTFLIFTDACCQRPTNTTPFVEVLEAGTGWGLTLGSYLTSNVSSPLNGQSPYKDSFTVNPISGGYYSLINNVPGENALYLAHGTLPADFPDATDRTGAYGFLIPQPSMNNGQGACTFVVADASPFAVSQAQTNGIMADFSRAALDPDGACKMASGATDLSPSFSGAGTASTAVATTVAVDVANLSASTDSTDGLLTVTLPVGVRLVSGAPLPAGCVEVPGATPTTVQQVSCTLSPISAGSRMNFVLPIIVEQDGNYALSAEVTSVTDENVTNNNTASYALAATPAPSSVGQVTPVPAMGVPAVLLLGMMLPLLAWRRRGHEGLFKA